MGGALGGAAYADRDDVVGVADVGDGVLLYGTTDLLGYQVGSVAVGVEEDYYELFAAETGEEVGGAVDDVLGGGGDGAEAGVAGEVAVDVVEGLEVVGDGPKRSTGGWGSGRAWRGALARPP